LERGGGKSPLLAAIDLNHLPLTLLLLERGADPNEGLLQYSGTSSSSSSSSRGGGGGGGGGGSAGVYSHPVLLAVVRGRAALVSALLEFGGGCNILIARVPSAEKGKGKGKGEGGGMDTDTLVDIARQRRDFDTMQALMAHDKCHPDAVRSAGTG
jgi:hypothetical protein